MGKLKVGSCEEDNCPSIGVEVDRFSKEEYSSLDSVTGIPSIDGSVVIGWSMVTASLSLVVGGNSCGKPYNL